MEQSQACRGGHRDVLRRRCYRRAGGGRLTRIIAGAAGGRRLVVPPRGTRPTTDRVRESLFNILTARVELQGMSILDLYAGSGALGLEALSRGAATVLFVESDHRVAGVLARNITTVGLPGATLRRGAVTAVLSDDAKAPSDLVLADPPYDLPAVEVEAVLAALAAHGWAGAGTVVAVERARTGPPLSWPACWATWQPRVYGDTRLEFAELKGGRANEVRYRHREEERRR
jgi:16S rRNA (guanine966-N2)-methyltransferase